MKILTAREHFNMHLETWQRQAVLLPFYWVCERLPATRESARRLGLITISQILDALVWGVENPAEGVRILDVPKIRGLARQ